MNELAPYQQGELPATMEDVAHFLLIAPEKATALRAEIRAIQKVGLAKAVYDQKLEEQRRLCDMILDASVRLGEMTKAIPKANNGGANQYGAKVTALLPKQNEPSGAATHGAEPEDSAPEGRTLAPSKLEKIHELGFSKMQVQRFETLADNKDLVEQEKALAREEGRMPTRTNVLNMAQKRKVLFQRDMAQIDEDAKWAKALVNVTHAPFTIADHLDEVAAAVWRIAEGNVGSDIEDIDAAIRMLNIIKTKLVNGRRLYGGF